MRTSVYQVRLAALIAAAFAGVSVAQERVFFTEYKYNDPTLQSMNLDGSDVQDLFLPENPFPPADWLPIGLAVDDGAGKIYWDHGSTPGRIRRANLDGSEQELLVGSLKISRGVSLDLAGGKMYWAASPPEGNAGGIIRRANLDGSGVETVYYDPDYDPLWSKIGRPTVDSVNGYVYFGSNGVIKRANLDGPPFQFQTVVTGGSTVTRVQLDVASGHIYWIDSDTISDCLIRANLDNSGFTVIVDSTPDEVTSSGLIDLALDLAGGKAYWADEIRADGTKVIQRADLDGGSLETIYASPSGWSPSSLAFDVDVPQPIMDCNGNGIRDKDDIDGGTSSDCNGNGIPDECEENPCEPPEYLLDQGFDPNAAGRQIGGAPENQRWMVFQPFDVPADGWEVAEFQINGVTWNYHADGFTATVFPDTGSDYPDESEPLASGNSLFRFAPEWETAPVSVTLDEGRYWLRLTANGDNAYTASVGVGTSGLSSFSRSGLGNDYFDRPPIALRILPTAGPPCPDLDGDGQVGLSDLAILLANYGETGGMAFEDGDLDDDGDVDLADLAVLLGHYGETCRNGF